MKKHLLNTNATVRIYLLTNEDIFLDYEENVEKLTESKMWKIGQYVTWKFSGTVFGTVIESVFKWLYQFRWKIIQFKNSGRYSKLLESILQSHHTQTKGIIIFPPTVDWNIALFQRPHHLARCLAKMGWFVFYCDSIYQRNIDGFKKLRENLYLTNQYELLRKKLENYTYIFSSTTPTISLKHVLDLKEKNCIVYDYIDDIDPAVTKHTELILKRHKTLLEKSDIVLATADILFSEVKKIRDDVYLLPNAADYSHFHIEKKIESIPDKIKKIKQKGNHIVGYFGALASWIDYDLIQYCASKRPDLEFVLIGPEYDKSFPKNKLIRNDNIHYLGVIPFSFLPKIAIWFDVCILPFKINNVTQATNPIKLFEYMSLRKPIVSTSVNEAKKYESVLIGGSYEEFLKKIELGFELLHDEKYLSILDKEAKENTWDKRANELSKLIEKTLIKKGWNAKE